MQKNAARRQCLRAAAHSGHIGYRDRALIEKRGNDMKAGKPFIVYTVGVCLLAIWQMGMLCQKKGHIGI